MFFISRLREETTACFFSQAAAILFASSSVLTFSKSAIRSPLPTWTLKYFSFWNVEIFPSRSTSIARVGVWTRPTTSFL